MNIPSRQQFWETAHAVYTDKQLAEHIELLHPVTVPDPNEIPW